MQCSSHAGHRTSPIAKPSDHYIANGYFCSLFSTASAAAGASKVDLHTVPSRVGRLGGDCGCVRIIHLCESARPERVLVRCATTLSAPTPILCPAHTPYVPRIRTYTHSQNLWCSTHLRIHPPLDTALYNSHTLIQSKAF